MITKSKITAALRISASATAAEIYDALRNAPRGSSVDFLLRALDGERVDRGNSIKEDIPSFSDIFDADDLEAALNEGLAHGSSLVDSAFCDALDNDAKERSLADDEGCPARPWGVDQFGEPFHLQDLIQDEPFAPPFTGELVTTINDLWFSSPPSSK